MKKDRFIEELLNEFADSSDPDAPKITVNTKLASIEGYDSLSVVSLVSFISKRFGINIIAKKLNEVGTIGDLMNLIGMDKFED